ncbi:ABC transporter ATP-binding protein uup [Commensalibacter sp. Nvir]|uniref:ABC-F family ATP-binding cassette domain-containing protein n=1 Tax=Commensalibacter sp. Nvir TaxID=3069817 RepID=UPI002D752858|nr:ABC transporter ATP-binding protein uup [Commensalibacter sp. Nvir]
MLVNLKNIHYTLGGTPLIENANFAVDTQDRIGLVGRNGSGKSTLLKIISGILNADTGEKFIQPGTSIQYLEQEPKLSKYKNLLDYVCSELHETQQYYRAKILLNVLNLSGDEKPQSLSGGEIKRCALAKALAPKPDLLLLDEPTNHLDLPAIEWLEEELNSLPSAMIIISHDRFFLEKITRKILWLDRGKTQLLNQRFSQFEQWKENFLEQELMDNHKLDRQIAREEDWVRYGVTARRKRNVRRMAELQELRKTRQEIIKNPMMTAMQANQGGISGKIVIDAKQISKSFSEKTIVKNLNLRILRNDRLGIIGPNGIGKSTLLKLLIGQEQPDSGEVKLGSNLEFNYLDQNRNFLDPMKTLAQTLSNDGGEYVHIGTQRKHVIGYMKEFMFRPEQAKTPIHVLSGGEKARVLIARALAKSSNIMVMDEPTNDLDLETLDLLQDFLSTYAGTVIIISHDRDFLDKVATSILVPEKDGKWIEYAGGYSDMMRLRKNSDPFEVIKEINSAKDNANDKTEKAKAKKLSFKDQYELNLLPKKIQTLEKEMAVLTQLLSDNSLYTRDPQQFQIYTEQLNKKHQDHHELEEKWFELELKREELERN